MCSVVYDAQCLYMQVDSSTQEVPCRADDGYMQWSGNTTDRVRTLLTRCGKRQEQSDNANGSGFEFDMTGMLLK